MRSVRFHSLSKKGVASDEGVSTPTPPPTTTTTTPRILGPFGALRRARHGGTLMEPVFSLEGHQRAVTAVQGPMGLECGCDFSTNFWGPPTAILPVDGSGLLWMKSWRRSGGIGDYFFPCLFGKKAIWFHPFIRGQAMGYC